MKINPLSASNKTRCGVQEKHDRKIWQTARMIDVAYDEWLDRRGFDRPAFQPAYGTLAKQKKPARV